MCYWKHMKVRRQLCEVTFLPSHPSTASRNKLRQACEASVFTHEATSPILLVSSNQLPPLELFDQGFYEVTSETFRSIIMDHIPPIPA